MTDKRYKHPAGLTFIEIMIATVILLIAIIGTSAFRYTTAMNARKADAQATAARVGLLLCEGWRGASDPCSFDPTALGTGALALSLADEGTHVGYATPDGFTLLGVYEATAEQVDYYAVLSWNDVSTGLKALNVVVLWNQRGSEAVDGVYPDKSFKLTTYVTR